MMDTPYFHVASRALVAGEVFSRWVGHDWMALIVTSGIEPSCPYAPVQFVDGRIFAKHFVRGVSISF